MGNLCSLPSVEITEEQKDSIKDLISNNEHFKTVYMAVPFLVPVKAKLHGNDLDKTAEAFMEDDRMLNNHPGHPSNLDDIGWSIKAAIEKINSAVAPVVESTLGAILKQQLPDRIPDSIKDKAVSVGVEKAVEKGLEQAIKKLVDKQLKGEPLPPIPGSGGAEGENKHNVEGGQNANHSSGVNPDFLRLQSYYAVHHLNRLPILNQSIAAKKKEGDIFKEELLFIIANPPQSGNGNHLLAAGGAPMTPSYGGGGGMGMEMKVTQQTTTMNNNNGNVSMNVTINSSHHQAGGMEPTHESNGFEL